MEKLYAGEEEVSSSFWVFFGEAPRPVDGASRQGFIIHIVPLDPTYKAGLAGAPSGQKPLSWRHIFRITIKL